jgi:hypothetical protein
VAREEKNTRHRGLKTRLSISCMQTSFQCSYKHRRKNIYVGIMVLPLAHLGEMCNRFPTLILTSTYAKRNTAVANAAVKNNEGSECRLVGIHMSGSSKCKATSSEMGEKAKAMRTANGNSPDE